MKKEELSALSNEALLKKQAGLKKGNTILIVVLSLLFILAVYISVTQKTFSPLVVVPLALSSIVFSSINQLKMIDAELERRA
ncbi:MAG: redox-active disulfide protein 2 [Bacteroidota bacterium]